MAKKRASSNQPLLFSTSDNDPSEGGHDAVQNDLSEPAGGPPGDARPAPPEPDPPDDAEPAGGRAADQPRGVEGQVVGDEPGDRPEPDQQRGDGTGPEGTGSWFTQRVGGRRSAD